MGQFLSNLNLRGGDAIVPELAFDINNPIMSDDESQSYQKLAELVDRGKELLKELEEYSTSAELIRKAIANPEPENETNAWNAVLPTVEKLNRFYCYADKLGETMSSLLSDFCSGDVNKNLEKHQATTRCFAELLNFVFEFDCLKMRNSALQNEFSYYRRMLQRGRYSASAQLDDNSMSDLRSKMMEDDQANRISLFIAYPTPMLKRVIDTLTDYVTKNKLQKNVGECLTALWAACFSTVKRRAEPCEETAFCLKVMVICIILYDHIAPKGAFSKHSPINIKHSVKIINIASKDSSASNLMSALRYNSKHLNDEATPKGVKNLVMAA